MKITTIRGILVLLAVLSAFIGKGQNLVPNPSFEEFDVCPPSTINTITTPRIRDFIRYWQDPPSSVATGPSSDYSHLCSENYNSTIVSATGAGHMGIFVRAGSSEYREYLQVRLLAPLCNGHTYEVKFKLADRDYTQFNVDRIGAHFSLNAVSSPADGFNINVTPQVTTPAGQFINNENNWREFTMNFVNTGGGEEWLTIGNFFNNANTNTQNGSGFFGGYIYIDDVSVIDITPSVIISSGVIANASCGVNDGSITGITVSGGSGSYSYEWLDTDNNIVSTNLDLVNVAGGDYRLIVDDAGCENLANTTFTVGDEGCANPCDPLQLVPNGNFEDFNSCPSGRALNPNEFSNQVREWYNPTQGTPDYLNFCDPQNPTLGPPDFPDAGYMRIHTWFPSGLREYGQVQLTQPMAAGEQYTVSLDASFALGARYEVDRLGIHFSNTPISASNNQELPVTPQLETPAGDFINNRGDWRTFTWTYTATGGEQYLTVGNFYNNISTNINDRGASSGGSTLSLLYIDDISVVEMGSAPTVDAGVDQSIAIPETANLTSSITGATPVSYSWSPSTGLNDSTSSSPVFTPTAAGTFTFEVVVNFGGCFETDQVTITVNTPLCMDTVDAGVDQTITQGDSATVTATPSTGAPTYTWSASPADASLAGQENDQNPNVSPTETTTYTVTADFGGGCTDTATVTITVNTMVSLPAACGTDTNPSIESTYNWYFGDRAGLSFATSPPTPINNGQTQNIREGSATISDNNGNLLFYTSGASVYNSSHSIMNNGTGLQTSESAVQGTSIVPKPGSPNEYYILQLAAIESPAVDGYQGFSYSVVDVTTNSVIEKNTTISNDLYQEKLVVVRHCNGSDYWIITLTQSPGQAYRVYLLASTGIALTASYPSAMSAPFNPFGGNTLGQLKANLGGNLLAHNGGANDVEVASFDNATGNIAVLYSLRVNTGSSSYGLEFSPDGSKLYSCQYNGNPGNPHGIVQFDLSSVNQTTIQASEQYLFQPAAQSGSLQLGIDQNIYVAVDGENRLGVIQNANSTSPTYTTTAAFGSGRNARLGLPNFISSNFNQLPDIVVADNCPAFNFSFSTALPSDITSVDWNFGDGNVATGTTVSHTYNRNDTFTVTALLNRNCGGVYCITTDVTVDCTPCTENISTGPDLTINQGDNTSLTVTPSGGSPTYAWTASPSDASLSGQENDQNPTVSPTQTTTYTVTADFGGGCTDTDTVTVTVDAPPLSCEGPSLVPNGDFESFSNCPSGGIGLDEIQNYINDWYQTSQFGTPDYFNTCDYYPSSVLAPTSGNASVGLQLYNPTGDYREYLQARLTAPLVPGNRYNLRFNIHFLEAFSQLKTDKIAVYFSTAPIDTGDDFSNIDVTPQLVYTAPTGQYIDNVDTWETIEFLDYNATDAFEYITIGNFDDNVSTNIAPANSAGVADIAYYALDDVVLEDTASITLGVTATPDLSIVIGDSASLFAVPVGGSPTYAWSANPSDPSLSGQENDQSPTVSPMQTTTYTVTADFGGGCTDTDTVVVTVESCTLALDSSNVNIADATCGEMNGSITGITVSGTMGTEAYQWTDASGTVVGNAIALSDVGLGSYTLTVTENDCSDSLTFNIDEVGLPDLDTSNVMVTDADCAGGNSGSITGIVFMGDQTGATYSWRDNTGIEVSNLGLDLTGVAQGTYTLTVTDNLGCGAVAGPFIINMVNGPSLDTTNVSITNADCGLATGGITGITGIDGNETYVWTDGNGLTVSNTLELQNIGMGSYTLTITKNSCSASEGPFDVLENGAPVIDDDQIVIEDPDCEEENGGISGISLLNTDGNETYRWTDADGIIVMTELILSNVGAGTYTLTVEENGCSVTAGPYTLMAPVDCDNPIDPNPSETIQIANTLTPNGDGANDSLMIRGLENYPNHRLYIYNRWGNKVYEASNYDNDWYGTYQGRPLPVGTYYYVLETFGSEKNIVNGYVSILR